MRAPRLSTHPVAVVLGLLLALLLPLLAPPAAPPVLAQTGPPNLQVYHELASQPDLRSINSPVLSGDARRAIWAESSADPPQPNRVWVMDVDGGQPQEIDAYPPLCPCDTRVDLSDDGGTAVSTDGVRIRALSGVATFGAPQELLRLATADIGALRLSGNGQLIVFLVLRDTTLSEPNPLKRGTPIPRGLWALSAAGGDPIHLAGAQEIADATGEPVAAVAAFSSFHVDPETFPLDVSDDGRRIVFAAQAESAGEDVFSLQEGGAVTSLLGPFERVRQVAVSGDGQTVAFATHSLGSYDIVVIAGGTLKSLPDFLLSRDERLQLSRDGATLLGASRLFDVATLRPRRLSGGLLGSSLLLRRDMFGYTMNATATRILYSGYTDTHQAVLAVIEVSPTSLGAAPLIKDVHVSPSTIPLDDSTGTTVTVAVAWEGTLVATELDILRDGEPDVQLARDPILLADTQGADPTRGQGIFETTGLTPTPQEGQTPVAGPRTLRILVESVAEDGLHHATILDVDDTLMVGAPPSAGTGELLFRLDGLPADEAAAQRIVDGLRDALSARPDDVVEVLAYQVEVRLDPNATRVDQGGTGGVLSVAVSAEAVNQTALEDPAREFSSESTHFTWETTGLLPPTTTSPWFEDGVGFMQFETVSSTRRERGANQEPPTVWTGWGQYSFALDETGSLVLCSATPERTNREQMRADCLAHPVMTLPRVT